MQTLQKVSVSNSVKTSLTLWDLLVLLVLITPKYWQSVGKKRERNLPNRHVFFPKTFCFAFVLNIRLGLRLPTVFVSTSPRVYNTACVWQQVSKVSAGWQFHLSVALFAAKTDGFTILTSPLSLDFLAVLGCTCGYIMVEAAYQKQLPLRMGLMVNHWLEQGSERHRSSLEIGEARKKQPKIKEKT